MPNGTQQVVALEQRLLLLAWLNSLFGYASNRELLADTKAVAEGFDASGRSHLTYHLLARGDKVKIAPQDLARYDDAIRGHLRAINERRAEPITLRYFQHLAVLYSEVYLDWLFNHREALLHALNAFVHARNRAAAPGEVETALFTDSDLQKVAFWMATGSGKTLIMHINYRQFLAYNDRELDNILLVTPNEGLSEQHMEEMAESGIPVARFDLNASGLGLGARDTVRVIEITKLVEEKRGGGVTVPVEAFQGNNLIFVDEGHKGSGGEVWRSYRDALGETGFTFEYSATFGQALTAARNDALTGEYGKAILFDYSYRYFYDDGFGKDFRILNLKDETREDVTHTLLLGNLLSFYQQLRVYEDQADAVRPYNLERPLWVFVGSTVNAVYTEDRQKRSDVLTVVRFLHQVLENRRGWAEKTIAKLLQGKSGLAAPDGSDVFAGKFQYLSDQGLTADQAYREILATVLHAPASGGLHLCDIRGADGELGLKAAGAEAYFGLIYIGDTSAFKGLVEDDESGITLEEDAIGRSLFATIGQPDTSVDILIGAKKFIEGWNSWRVSTMGLLNIGRQEGSQIIQLFGRGVRLRGKDFSLKRSAALDGHHPEHLRLLETLNIFAVRANYMQQFRDYLEREGVETEGSIELPLFIWANQAFLRQGLVVPRVAEDHVFAREAALALAPLDAARVFVDLTPRVQTLDSARGGVAVAEARAGDEAPIPEESLSLVDWERVYLDLVEYKRQRGLANLVIPRGAPREIMGQREPSLYRLVVDEAAIKPASFAGVTRLQETVMTVLRQYVDKFYRVRREQWETETMVYRPLDATDPNLALNPNLAREGQGGAYILRIPRSERALIEAVEKLIADADALRTRENASLPRLAFDRHLYSPLLIEKSDKITSVPPGLKESEVRFLRDIKAYWAEAEARWPGVQVYVLRNLSRGKGIGFFEERGFYPDFILWLVDGEVQHIVFIEPHGMLLGKQAYQHDDKVRLHERLPELGREIGARSGRANVTLDSYIISATPYDDLYKVYDDGSWDVAKFAARHILFPRRDKGYDYIEAIFRDRGALEARP